MEGISKKTGAAGAIDMIPVMITIVVCGIIILYFSVQIKYLDVCNSVNNLAREYILKMESSRGLSDADRLLLLESLRELGVSNISLEGTTYYDSSLRPGDDIRFCLQCIYGLEEMSYEGMLNINIPGVERSISLEKNSVCLK